MQPPRRIGDPVRLVRGRRAGAEGVIESLWGPGRYWARVALDGTTIAVPRANLQRIPRRRRALVEHGRLVPKGGT